MPTCEVCENEYDKAFEIVLRGECHTFDSFECAIHALAPLCPHCNCRIVGHGVEADGQIFRCVHCARTSGTTQLKGPHLNVALVAVATVESRHPARRAASQNTTAIDSMRLDFGGLAKYRC